MSEVRNCPICGGELEKGFVYASHGIRWNSKEHKHIAVGEILIRLSFFTFTAPRASGLRCKKCRLVLFHY
nr:PF20097 family protein [Candidatus Freyarchaeota archaeon]